MPIDAQPIAPEGFASFALVESIIPVGSTTFTLTFGPYTDALGGNVPDSLTGTLHPVDQITGKRVNVVHLTSGQVIIPTDIPIVISGGSASLGPLPHTGQADLTPFFYRVEWNVSSSSRTAFPGHKTFAAPASAGDTIDFDLLGIGTPAADISVPIVDGVIAALLEDPTSATYAKVIDLIATRTGFGRGA